MRGMPTPCEQAIARTLAYVAQFRYPLTEMELWKWLMADVPVALEDVVATVRGSAWLQARVTRCGAYVGIGDDVAQQVEERAARAADAAFKHRRALRYARWIARIPGVEGIALCNSVALHHTTPESDIDFFLVTAPGAVWRVRACVAFLLAVLRQRPGERRQHALCASFFVDRTALAMEQWKIGPQDPYLAMWCATLMPMFGAAWWETEGWHANAWVTQILPNATPVRRAPAFAVERKRWRLLRPRFARARKDNPSSSLRGVLSVAKDDEAISNRAIPSGRLERRLHALQFRHLPSVVRAMANADTRVVLNEHVIKIHTNDRRAAFLAQWETTCRELGV